MKAKNWKIVHKKKKFNKKNESKNGLIKLVKCLNREGFCPCIVFAFSKKECENNAIELYKYNPSVLNKFQSNKNLNLENEHSIDFNSEDEKKNIETIFFNCINKLSKEDQELPNIQNFLPLLKRGIGVHHGGMLPILKECV
jgi:ATP-dependent RNA helicase DOB1